MKRYDIKDLSPCINDDGTDCSYKQWCKNACKEYKRWAKRKKRIVEEQRNRAIDLALGRKWQKGTTE